MPQSLSEIVVHIVFSTKNRTPHLTPEVRRELYPYVGKLISEEGSHPILIGGYVDHMHLLIDLGRSSSVSKLVQNTKADSTKWLRRAWPFLATFGWQSGYCAFSARPCDKPLLIDYIANQEEHHRTWAFQDELRALMSEHGRSYDERYVWD